MSTAFQRDVVVVGGCGHVGLPLGLAFASQGLSVALFDINETAVKTVSSGQMPFEEAGAAEVLARVLDRSLTVSSDVDVVSGAESVVVVVGTPVDEHLNPDPTAVCTAVRNLGANLRDGQLLVLRSTVYPGTTALVEGVVRSFGLEIEVVFCPERIAEGKAMSELFELPQIVSGRSPAAIARAEALFGHVASKLVPLSPEEAELAKLFTNAWRYIKFATANQLFMMANNFQLDYERIRQALIFDYPRAADLPAAGFTAGPCLLKDTMQLAAFMDNNFVLGHSAMLVNEGLPLYVVSKLEERCDLTNATVGILGMAFKGESDDIRSSLSYKLKHILRFKAREVLCHDPYVSTDPDLQPIETLLDRCGVLIIAAPHEAYRSLRTTVPIVDIWGITGRGTRV